jgi:hypothetical protein
MLPTPFCTCARLFTLSLFQMAEEGWTQGNCQAAPGFPSLLVNALESLGVTECPRYYSREYEHHGTLRCRVILVIARSNRYPDIQPWRVTAIGFRHQDTYPLTVRKALHYLCWIFERHLAPTPMRFFPPAIRTPVWEVSHPIYKNINRAIIYAPGSSHAYIQQIIKISQHMSRIKTYKI